MTLKEIHDYVENHKEEIGNISLSSCRGNWFQISLIKSDNEPCRLSDIHFEIRKIKDDTYRLDIHFEENDTTRYKNNQELQELVNDNDFEWIRWWTSKKNNKNPDNKSLKCKEITISTEKELEDFFEEIKEIHKKFNDILITILNEESTKKEEKKSMQVKNIILYGSPGVGKTHNTNKLIRLIEEGKSDRDIFEAIKKNEKSNSIDISDIKERVKFVTFHQSFGYEDFIEGFRPNEEGDIELVDGIFKQLSNEAKDNFMQSIRNNNILHDEEKKKKILELFIDKIQDEIDAKGKYYINQTVYIFAIEDNAFRYQGDNWKNSQRMKFSDILLIMDFPSFGRKDIKTIPNISGLAKQHATYYAYLAKQLLDFREKVEITIDIDVKKEELKNYYLIIDEINRGNISKIFGELITLIEEDKRDNLEVTLPYSKQPFKIPSNLYIIGTMNSTDKSIALIDIALRRRFTFLKMEPNAELIIFSKAKEIFIALNEQITKDLGEDYQIGHSYFMQIADEDELKFVLDYKIIPLLEEYYYGDDRLGEIVKKFEK